jgi:hypothetical protein
MEILDEEEGGKKDSIRSWSLLGNKKKRNVQSTKAHDGKHPPDSADKKGKGTQKRVITLLVVI